MCFTMEKRFSNLKLTNSYLRYDFYGYLSIGNGLIIQFIIELDGPHHFKQIFGDFEEKKKRDIYKDYYCIVNRICLLRIDIYNHKGSFEQIIKTFFAQIKSTKRLIHEYIGDSYSLKCISCN